MHECLIFLLDSTIVMLVLSFFQVSNSLFFLVWADHPFFLSFKHTSGPEFWDQRICIRQFQLVHSLNSLNFYIKNKYDLILNISFTLHLWNFQKSSNYFVILFLNPGILKYYQILRKNICSWMGLYWFSFGCFSEYIVKLVTIKSVKQIPSNFLRI